jgi:hypothetical protein
MAPQTVGEHAEGEDGREPGTPQGTQSAKIVDYERPREGRDAGNDEDSARSA